MQGITFTDVSYTLECSQCRKLSVIPILPPDPKKLLRELKAVPAVKIKFCSVCCIYIHQRIVGFTSE